MNGGISSTTTTPTGQTNDPAALLNTLMASAPGGLHMGAQYDADGNPLPEPVLAGGAPSPAAAAQLNASPKTGGLRLGDRIYYSDGTSEPVTDDTTPPPPPPPPPPPDVDEPPPTPPPPPIRPPQKWFPPGEGSVNEEARKRGEMLTSFLASFQAAFQRQNPNFNFARNPKLARSLNLPWSGDIGR
jgi:hypothetical protein